MPVKHKYKLLSVIPFSVTSYQSMAVQLGEKGMGQVLIYPYYTVNNELNTLYSIVNTTAQAKAVKVRFLEGMNGQDVLDFNIYLSPFDVWTGALVPSTSTVAGHVGEPTVLHLSNDTTCAPYLVKSGQEFLPFLLDLDLGNNDLQRARDGHFEVIEMGVLSGDALAAVVHSSQGVPSDCAAIQAAWDSGDWALDQLENPTGGLYGAASLVNVSQGISFSFDAVALDRFWLGRGEHTSPGSITPDLNSSHKRSSVLLSNGVAARSNWSVGFEAVSAVLLNSEVYNEYAYDTFINGKSEWVLTFPTKSYHVNPESAISAPFSQNWNGFEACDKFSISHWDRAEQQDPPFHCGGITCPPVNNDDPELCFSSNVIEFLGPDNIADVSTEVLGANNKMSLVPVELFHATESGWSKMSFLFDNQVMTPISGVSLKGIPVTGFSIQQFTNSGASAGLLAQYGSLFKHKGLVISQ